MIAKCAICKKGKSSGRLGAYPTILSAMGYSEEYTHAHTKCVIKVQQTKLNLRTRL